MAGAEFGFHARQRVVIDLDGLAVPAKILVDEGQAVQDPERIRVVGPESGFSQRQRLLPELEGVGVSAEAAVAEGEAVAYSKGFEGPRGRAWLFSAPASPHGV